MQARALFFEFQDQQSDTMTPGFSMSGPLPDVTVAFAVWGPPNFSTAAAYMVHKVTETDIGRTFVMPANLVEAMQGFGTDPRPVSIYSTVTLDCQRAVSQNCRIGNNHFIPFPPFHRARDSPMSR